MFCTMCGTQIADGTNVCPKCGHAFSAPAAAPVQPAPEAAPVQPAPQPAPAAAPVQPAPEAAPAQPAPVQPVPQPAPDVAPAQPAPQQFQQVPPQQYQQPAPQQFQQVPPQQYQQPAPQQFQQVPPQQYQQPAPQQFQQVPPQQYQQPAPQQFQQVPPQQYQQIPPQQYQQPMTQQFQQVPPQQYQQPMTQQFQQFPPQQYQQGYAQPAYPPKPPFDLFQFVCNFFGRANRGSGLFQLIIVGVLLVEFILWIIYPGADRMNGFSGFGDFFSMRQGAMVVAGIFHIISFLAIGASIAMLFLKKLAKRDFFFNIATLAYAGCKLIVFIVVVAASSGRMVLGGDIAAIVLSVGVFILSLQINKKEALMNPYNAYTAPVQQNPYM